MIYGTRLRERGSGFHDILTPEQCKDGVIGFPLFFMTGKIGRLGIIFFCELLKFGNYNLAEKVSKLQLN